jgi:leucyl/phenylalanyl-tRNA--protein transferase
VGQALDEPDGLLAWGGGLETERLMCAYRSGIFPWYGPDQPILWWSPQQR